MGPGGDEDGDLRWIDVIDLGEDDGQDPAGRVARVTSQTEMPTRAVAGTRSRSGAEACGRRIACWSAATSSGTVGR